ncbi:MAG: phage virion morphogenesis protein [Nitrincola lacisaponensis]|uniref:phage virion morphogenesis protein n=1 Tax=Nitrincola lacisaponensis TaxID=267850 RepID=UPI003919CEB5
MAELDHIEKWVTPLLEKLQPAERKQLARIIATDLRRSQRQRIIQQRNPDGSRYAAGQKRRAPLNKPKRFYYERTGRVAELKSYADYGDRYTGYDIEAGGIRTFLKEHIGDYYTPEKSSSGSIRQKKGRIKQKMFTKLSTARYLKQKYNPSTVSVGFFGNVARIARVHQYGLRDRVAKNGPEVQYEKRELLGFTEQDKALIEQRLIEYLT